MRNQRYNYKKYYFVIAAKRKKSERVCMVMSHQQLMSLLDMRYPVYKQSGYRSMEAAERDLKSFMSVNADRGYRQMSFDEFLSSAGESKVIELDFMQKDKDVICFYDSEFGMYNYGDQQGDVVSMGAVILHENGNSIFHKLIRNTDREQMAERFTAFTGLRKEELMDAPGFPEVFAEFVRFIEDNNVRYIYCLGGNDRERLEYMLTKYRIFGRRERAVLDKFMNFQRWLRRYDERLSYFSLESLSYICDINNENQHDALSDAVTLAMVWEKLSSSKISDKAIRAEQEAVKLRNRYKKNRKISYERIAVSHEIIELKDRLLAELRKRNQETKAVSTSVMKALCDDLDELLIEGSDVGQAADEPAAKRRRRRR